jgi:hypothetical protein
LLVPPDENENDYHFPDFEIRKPHLIVSMILLVMRDVKMCMLTYM